MADLKFRPTTPNSTKSMSAFTTRVSEILTQLKSLDVSLEHTTTATFRISSGEEFPVKLDGFQLLLAMLSHELELIHDGRRVNGKLIDVHLPGEECENRLAVNAMRFFRRDIYAPDYLTLEKALRVFGVGWLRPQNVVRMLTAGGVVEERSLGLEDTFKSFSAQGYSKPGILGTFYGYQLHTESEWKDFGVNALDYTVLNEHRVRTHDPDIFFIGNYHTPYKYGEPNRYFSNYSRDLLQLKDCHEALPAYFAEMLRGDQIVRVPLPIVSVPSSNSATTHNGIRRMAMCFCSSRDNGLDATSCLVRHTSIQPLHEGGDRSLETHLNSVCVQHSKLIAGKVVLLLDDVTTNGNSLRACAQLLLQAGALHVVKLALARTWR